MSETLTQAEFTDLQNENELVLAFVGMSNCGKSRWSKFAEEDLSFERLVCDELIQYDLDDLLINEGFLVPGVEGIEAMAEWMGQPGDERYRARESQYLALEEAKMNEILDWVEAGALQRNTIIDTTGSIVHLRPEIYERLGSLATVVHLETDLTPQVKDEMFAKFIETQKPLVWGNSFNQFPGESVEEAIARCYPELLVTRHWLYEKGADVTLPREQRYGFSEVTQFMDAVKNGLPA